MGGGESMKQVFIVLGFFVAVFLLYGVFTCGWFAWWMIPTGILSAGYMIGFFVYEFKKVKRGEW